MVDSIFCLKVAGDIVPKNSGGIDMLRCLDGFWKAIDIYDSITLSHPRYDRMCEYWSCIITPFHLYEAHVCPCCNVPYDFENGDDDDDLIFL